MTLDPITLAVMANALGGVAEEMGIVLIRGAYSSNIKERHDCSTALFDPRGRCVAQAAHIPVHLGALPGAVAAVLEHAPGPGEAYLLNDPFRGGSHLPDVTLVSALDLDGEVIAYAVSRCHYAEIGGMTPGSMPSGATEIYQEGLVIPPIRIVRDGRLVEDVFELILANVRTPEVVRGDLRAQIAAGAVAAERLGALVERHGAALVRDAFAETIAYAERRTRALVASLPDGTYRAEGVVEGDGIDEGDIPLRVAVTIDGERLVVDFAGTSAAVPGNVNAPIAVTRSACLFALRTLLDPDVPANAGSEAVLEVRTEPGSLVDARRPAAVAAGNVETSQRILDAVLAALAQAADVPAQGQGTMNNVVIGGADWSYYETIGGGQGGGPAAPGDSGVHVGMTNTLNTPIESLELEYPLRVERYELTGGRGGDGRHRGGDGIERSLRMLAPATLSLLSDRRRHAPRGAHGGGDGGRGENLLNGEPLPAKATRALAPGDVVTVRTPGGGGWGAPAG